MNSTLGYKWYTMRMLIVLFVLGTISARVHKKGETDKPNILFILTDDMGYNDIGFNNPVVQSDTLTELANDGAILDTYYAQPSCTPSRHALLTSTYPYKHGMGHMVFSETAPTCDPLYLKYLPERLQEEEYKTHLLGKWHLGYCDDDCTPTGRGFDSHYGHYGGQQDYYTHVEKGGYDWHKNGDVDFDASGTYVTDLITQRAKNLIDDHESSDPLFLALFYNAPHTPLQAPDKFLSKYDGQRFSDDEQSHIARKTYLAMVSAMDDSVRQVKEQLEDNGLWENTLVIFSSDNGGEYGATHWSNNAPFRGGKASLWEGGVRVPAFVGGPAFDSPNRGERIDGMFHITDWMPTIMHAITGDGFDEDADYEIDGIDQYDMIFNGDDSDREMLVLNLDLEFPAMFGQAAVRVENMKLIWGFEGVVDGYDNHTFGPGGDNHKRNLGHLHKVENFKRSGAPSAEQLAIVMAAIQQKAFDPADINSGIVHLFDIEDDPAEENDLSGDASYAVIVQEMKEFILEEYANNYRAPVPEFSMTDDNANPELHGGAWVPGWCDATKLPWEYQDS